MTLMQLAEIYPQLYLDPDVDEQSEYQRIVRRGERPKRPAVNWFHGHPEDREETVETPVGPVRMITLGDRRDFESFVRNMLAAKNGPRAEIPATMGAATLVVFNWPRIHAHKAAFLKAQAAQGVLFPDWPAEFRRFTAVKSNYGWYIKGNQVDFTPEALTELRTAIRAETKRLLIACRKNHLPEEMRLFLVISRANRLIDHWRLPEAFRVVSVDEGLREIDRMLYDMIRTVASGKKGSGRYRIRSERIREWGYKSLVNRYYRFISGRCN